MGIMKRIPARKSVIFGSGKMACGLLGELLYESGYETTFVVRNREKLDSISSNQGYFVGVAGETDHWVRVRKCRAVSADDHEGQVEAVATADIVFTAVGIDNLPEIAPVLAEGLWRRADSKARPLNIIASENLPGTGAYLRHQILNGSSADKTVVLDRTAGFSAAMTHRIMTGGKIRDGVLHFTVDTPGDLLIDRRGLVEPLPDIYHASITGDFDALFMKKLSTINLAQAVAAYAGHRYGCEFVHEAATHPQIEPMVKGALAEAAAAFKAEFPHLAPGMEHEGKDALMRIADPGLGDTVTRIARGPQRKLAAQERLVGPARLAARHGLPYDSLAYAIAAAMCYEHEDDAQSRAMQYSIAREGVDKILTEVSGLLPHEPLAQCIKRHWALLSKDIPKPASPTNDELLNDIMAEVERDLCEEYDDATVRETLAAVAAEFREARISTFLDMLIRKRASEHIRVCCGASAAGKPTGSATGTLKLPKKPTGKTALVVQHASPK